MAACRRGALRLAPSRRAGGAARARAVPLAAPEVAVVRPAEGGVAAGAAEAQAPALRDKVETFRSPEAQRERTLRRLQLERAEADRLRKEAAERREREEMEPAYRARAEAVVASRLESQRAGLAKEDARVLAEQAGADAFELAKREVDAARAERREYEEKLEERRRAAAERSKEQQAADAAKRAEEKAAEEDAKADRDACGSVFTACA